MADTPLPPSPVPPPAPPAAIPPAPAGVGTPAAPAGPPSPPEEKLVGSSILTFRDAKGVVRELPVSQLVEHYLTTEGVDAGRLENLTLFEQAIRNGDQTAALKLVQKMNPGQPVAAPAAPAPAPAPAPAAPDPHRQFVESLMQERQDAQIVQSMKPLAAELPLLSRHPEAARLVRDKVTQYQTALGNMGYNSEQIKTLVAQKGPEILKAAMTDAEGQLRALMGHLAPQQPVPPAPAPPPTYRGPRWQIDSRTNTLIDTLVPANGQPPAAPPIPAVPVAPAPGGAPPAVPVDQRPLTRDVMIERMKARTTQISGV